MKKWSWKKKVVVGLLALLGLGLVVPRIEYYSKCPPCYIVTEGEMNGGEVCPFCVAGGWRWREPVIYSVYRILTSGRLENYVDVDL